MKDLIISHSEEKGFYCDEFNYDLFGYVLKKLIDKYDLITDNRMMIPSEIEHYFCIRELNKDKFNIELREEDGNEWVFG